MVRDSEFKIKPGMIPVQNYLSLYGFTGEKPKHLFDVDKVVASLCNKNVCIKNTCFKKHCPYKVSGKMCLAYTQGFSVIKKKIILIGIGFCGLHGKYWSHYEHHIADEFFFSSKQKLLDIIECNEVILA